MIFYNNNKTFSGISTDTKPLSPIASTGDKFYETNTQKFYEFDGSSWTADPAIIRYNVLDYGLVSDGVTDNTTAFNNMLSNIPNECVVYFPQGKYRFTEPITINKFSITICGDTRFNKEYVTIDRSSSQSILYYDGIANTTFMTKGASCYSFAVYGISFYANTYSHGYNTDAFEDIPYYIWKFTTTVEAVNGLDVSTNGTDNIAVTHCCFYGFSGYALSVFQHVLIRDCAFGKDNRGVEMLGTDHMVQNCWFSGVNIAIYGKPRDTSKDYINVAVQDTWIDQCTNAIYLDCGSPMILAKGIWFDMFDEAAIVCTGNLTHSNIDGRISRAGMSYAGMDDSIRTRALGDKCDSIHCNRISDCTFNINTQRRIIGHEGSTPSPNRVCPSRVISTTSGVIITSDFIDYTIDFDYAYYRDYGNGDIPHQFTVHTRDKEARVDAQVYEYSNILTRYGSPIGTITPDRINAYYFNPSTKILYRSIGTTNQDWERVNGITMSELKTVAATSSDFADFQTKVAAL